MNDRLSDEQVKKLTQLVFDNAQELQLTVSADVDVTLEKAVEGVKIPFSQGCGRILFRKRNNGKNSRITAKGLVLIEYNLICIRQSQLL